MATLMTDCHYDRESMTLDVQEFRQPPRTSEYIIEVQNKPHDLPGVVSRFAFWLPAADADALRDKLIELRGLPDPKPVGKTHGLPVMEGEPELVDELRRDGELCRDEGHD